MEHCSVSQTGRSLVHGLAQGRVKSPSMGSWAPQGRLPRRVIQGLVYGVVKQGMGRVTQEDKAVRLDTTCRQLV